MVVYLLSTHIESKTSRLITQDPKISGLTITNIDYDFIL